MPLAMSRPWKHPDSGVYWLREPEDLRALVGKREEKRSLQTRDPQEAKRRHTEALAELENRWGESLQRPRNRSMSARPINLLCLLTIVGLRSTRQSQSADLLED